MQSKNLFERRFDERRFQHLCTSGAESNDQNFHRHCSEERLDHDIRRLGQCISTSKAKEATFHAHTKRFLKQAWKRWMSETRKVFARVKVCTFELVRASTGSAAQVGIQTMSTRSMLTVSTRHDDDIACGQHRNRCTMPRRY